MEGNNKNKEITEIGGFDIDIEEDNGRKTT